VKSRSAWGGGKGRVLDNLFIERFWRSLKQEKIYLIILNTVKEAKNAITSYITFYKCTNLWII
jgi:putative transposase